MQNIEMQTYLERSKIRLNILNFDQHENNTQTLYKAITKERITFCYKIAIFFFYL